MGTGTYDYHKYAFRQHLVPEDNEELDVGLSGRRFGTVRAATAIIDTITNLVLTVNTLTVATGLTLSYLVAGYVKTNASGVTALQATPIPVGDGGTGQSATTAGYVKGGATFSIAAPPLPAADGGLGVALPASGYLKGGAAAVVTQAVPIPVADGGTGTVSTLSGYLKGGSPITAQATPLPAADLGTGAAGGKFLRGDQTWQPPATLKQIFRNLHLRTHPDNDKAANQVALINLDEVAMDDGSIYLSPVVAGTDAPLTADITVAGAGGLDTGARVASTWYEPWLIGKSSTQAKADLRLLLHRAKDYFLDQSQTGTGTGNIALRDAAARTQIGQGFKVATAGKIERIDLSIAKVGAPTGNIWIELRSDNAGVPSTTVLATSDKFDVSKVSTTLGLIAFIFRNPFSAALTTQYHMVLLGDFAIGVANLTWGGVNTNPYANGAQEQFDGATWTTTALNDSAFKLYVTRNDAAVTMPAGYDQKAKLAAGFFNNSGNALVGSVFRNRRVRFLLAQSLGVITSTTPVLTDLSTIIPPGMIATWLFISTTNDQRTTSGPIPDGFGIVDLADSVGDASSYIHPATVPTGVRAPFTAPLHTEFQGLYVLVSGGVGETAKINGWGW